MTTINQTALLNAAITALVSAVAELKKAGLPHIGLGSEIIEGVKYRDLKDWQKGFKANQKAVTPAPVAKETKPAASAKKDEAKSSGDVRDLELSKSSNIDSATYDRANKTLRVTFKNGAVYDYAGVGIREANAFEKAESAGVFFKNNIKGHKAVTKIKGAGKAETAAPAPKATEKAPRANAKAPAPKAEAAPAVEFTASELRGFEVLNGRKVELIAKVVTNKETGKREIVTASGVRYEVASLRKNNRGRFVVEAAPAAKPAAKAETVKDAKAPRTNRKADLSDAKEQANNVRKSKPLPAAPKAGEVRGQEVRVIKGSKDKMVKVVKIVTRDSVRVALTENGFALPFNQIMVNDDQLTYMGKLTADEYRAA